MLITNFSLTLSLWHEENEDANSDEDDAVRHSGVDQCIAETVETTFNQSSYKRLVWLMIPKFWFPCAVSIKQK